ncbi:MAG: molybdenum cofactor guanylyltransferase, partial [Nitrospirae bacterium]
MLSLILAGGSNRRYPILKPFIEIEGQRIIDRQLKLLTPLFDDILLSTNLPEVYFSLGLRMVGDIGRSCGPLSGILSGLLASEEEKLFVLA